MRILFTISISLFTSIIYSQVNRYTDLTPSTYNSTTNSQTTVIVQQQTPTNIYGDYYRQKSINQIEQIKSNLDYYYKRCDIISKSDSFDDELKEDIKQILLYFDLMEKNMDLNDAQSIVNKIEKLYNRAIQNYRKRHNLD